MAALILENPLSIPKDLLMYGLRHLREDVKESCKQAIVLQVKRGELSWIERLRKSSSRSYRRAYVALVLKEDVQISKKLPTKSKVLDEFVLLKKIASSRSSTEVRPLLKSLQKMHPPIWIELLGKTLTYIRERHIESIMKMAQKMAEDKVEIILSAIDNKITSDDFNIMLSTYIEWNSKERDRYKPNNFYIKSNALASAIFRAMDAKYIPRIRKTMKVIRLTQSSREIAHALLKYGTLKDFKFLLNRIANEEQEIYFLNHTELGITTARRLEKIIKNLPKFLHKIGQKEEFWRYIHSEERDKLMKKDLLPIKAVENRRLYIRLAAYGMIGAARIKDQDFLIKLSAHNYGLIARTAAIKLVRILGENALRKLSVTIDDAIKRGDSKLLAESLRSAEIDLYEVAKLL